MLVKIHKGKPVSTASTSNEASDNSFLINNPSYIKTSFSFEQPLFCYEYVDGSFKLVANWEQLKTDSEQEQEGNVRNAEDKYVPQTLSARQARLALHRAGKLADVATVIGALTEPMKSEVKIEWEYATEFKRTNPLILALMGGMGLDDAAMDDIFILGGAIEA